MDDTSEVPADSSFADANATAAPTYDQPDAPDPAAAALPTASGEAPAAETDDYSPPADPGTPSHDESLWQRIQDWVVFRDLVGEELQIQQAIQAWASAKGLY